MGTSKSLKNLWHSGRMWDEAREAPTTWLPRRSGGTKPREALAAGRNRAVRALGLKVLPRGNERIRKILYGEIALPISKKGRDKPLFFPAPKSVTTLYKNINAAGGKIALIQKRMNKITDYMAMLDHDRENDAVNNIISRQR
jgi:hypothetical protein